MARELHMADFENRRQGLLWGSFVGESLSLAVHWIYDPEQLLLEFSDLKCYQAPGKKSYHPHKQAGDQGHVGDQALILCDSLVSQGIWNSSGFMDCWIASWDNYPDYLDKATKTVLEKIKQGSSPLNAASDSDELAGPARMAPLIAYLAGEDSGRIVDSALSQTLLTHGSADAKEAASFLATLCCELLQGADLTLTVSRLSPSWALTLAQAQLDEESITAVGALGRSCSIRAALPSVIYLLLKYGEDVENALYQNTVAGGDNCARGLVLGMILGAAHGKSALSSELILGLNNSDRIEAVLAS